MSQPSESTHQLSDGDKPADGPGSGDPYGRYLRLLEVPRREPGIAALAELTSAHLAHVPFENVSKLYHRKDAGMRLPELARFLDGIERHHFGGTCYPNNFHFHELLGHLGYRVSLCGADMSAPDVHVVNTVDLAGRQYLVDVGYAAPFLSPLPLDRVTDQEVRWGSDRYVLKPRDSAGRSRMEFFRDGCLRHEYHVNPRPRRIQEFERVIAASFEEGATFMNALLLARFFPGGSLTLRNLTVGETREGSTSVTRLPDRDALPAAVERLFGIQEGITRLALEGVDLTASV
jgi:arylamine N-acetyltransferase